MKNVLITGCSTGIGYSAAVILHNKGYNVIATVRTDDDEQRINELGIKCIQLDLNTSEAIKLAFDQVMRLFDQQLDVLFNNAAYGQPGAVEDLSREVLRQQFETNVFGTQELTNLAIAQMRHQQNKGGRIIYNSSVLGIISMAYRGAYNASKYALEGLADTLRQELVGSGISVSLIEPGPIISQFRANAFQKYKANINAENSAHSKTYQAMERRLSKQGASAPFTLSPEAVVSKLLHAIESKRAKPRYYVTFPTYLFATLKRILPHRCLDWVLMKVSQGEHR